MSTMHGHNFRCCMDISLSGDMWQDTCHPCIVLILKGVMCMTHGSHARIWITVMTHGSQYKDMDYSDDTWQPCKSSMHSHYPMRSHVYDTWQPCMDMDYSDDTWQDQVKPYGDTL